MEDIPRAPLAQVILDEIALEGLEGITLSTLWIYLSASLQLPLPLADQLRDKIWAFIKRSNDKFLFYELPQERATVKLYNRFENVDPDLGVPIVPEECPFPRYKFSPIHDGSIMGSCEFYKERKLISVENVKDLSINDVLQNWGNKFVIVGTQELRQNVLIPENVAFPKDLTSTQFCICEAIGRSRFNGETTGGIWSLLNFCKDSTIVFYIKNRLIRHGVLIHQPIHEKRNDRLNITSLVRLPRFYSNITSMLTTVIEKIFQLLKEAPEHRLSMTTLRRHFPTVDRQKTFKRIMVTHLFRRFFETRLIPYSQAEGKKRSKSKENSGSKERNVLFVYLRNPNLLLEELFVEENEEKEDNDEDFHTEKHAILDMSAKYDLYRAIARHGSRGCSHSELSTYANLSHLTVRQMLRGFVAEGIVKSYFTDMGRQRINMYVAIENSDNIKKGEEVTNEVIKNLQCNEEPNLPSYKDAALSDVPQISSRIKIPSIETLPVGRDVAATPRQLARKMLVVKFINENGLMQLCDLRISIQRIEKEKHGYKEEMCQKSMRRLLSQMTNANIVRIYEVILQFEEQIRIYRYVTHPKIDIEHEALKHEIHRLKNNYFLNLEDKRLRDESAAKDRTKRAAETLKKPVRPAEKKAKELIPLHVHKPPKFLMSRYMHEFLFYIVVELNEYQMPIEITEEVLQQWKIIDPSLDGREYMEQMSDEKITAYTKYISWRTFIPPLPKYADKPAGWVYFVDVMERIPLSIFNKIFRIEKETDRRLVAYLSHPVRQHYLMHQLPSDIQCQINRIHLQRVYLTVLKLLNHMGLIQVSERKSLKDPLVMWIYLNRLTVIMDTTSSEASYAKVNPDREYVSLKYEFGNLYDVHRYWTNLQRICVYTKLGFRKNIRDKVDQIKDFRFVRFVEFDEAPVYDTGEVPGDHLGAGGLSTNLFAHTFRNWSWVLHTNSKPKLLHTGRISHTSGAIRNKNSRLVTIRKNVTHPVKRLQSVGSVSGGAAALKRISAKKSGPIRDAIDRDALKHMRTLRVKWHKEEDTLLKISRAVYLYIAAPVIALSLLNVGKICRDILRHTLKSYNKTSQACLRRIQFVIKQNRHVPEVPTWLNMLQIDESMQQKYGDNFLHRLKRAYPNRTEYYDALMIHFVFLMHFLYNVVYNKNRKDSEEISDFTIPDTIAEFTRVFRERVSATEEQTIQHLNPTTEFQLHVTIAYNVLHSSLCSACDKTLYNAQAFEIYKNFSEEILHNAFTKARSDALAVAVKRKQIQMIPSQTAGPQYLLSQRYRLRLMFLKIPYPVYDYYYSYFENLLRTFFGPSSSTVNNHVLELKSPHSGQMLVIAEGLAQNYLKTNIKLPINILTVDAEQRQTSCSMDRILDHYHSIFDNAPQTEYTKNFENEPTEKQVRVKFHPANLSYKVHYNPYDFISKLPSRYLHFFCALDHLQQEVDINFSKLHRKDEENDIVLIECPFNCIMKHANYINAIERIVQEKKLVLNELTEMPPQKLLNMAMSGCSVTVQTTNLLTLVRMLESFWREKEIPSERKDLGKISNNVKANKSIDWNQLCNDILQTSNSNEEDNDKNDEYEPTLNKEERIARAQDVFVINLPTLQIGIGAKLCNAEMIERNKLEVPKCLIETALNREEILDKIIKESYWKYTDNTFETLKPKLAELNFNAMEYQHLEEVHNFIQSHELGVTVIDLMHEFPYEQFLQRSLRILSDFYLIKRVGVSTYMYVHKSHVRSWVVHTFHLKRLERESLGASTAWVKRRNQEMETNNADEELEETGDELKPSSSKKAKRDESADDDEALDTQPSTSKNVKLNENTSIAESKKKVGKRIPKPVRRYKDTDETNSSKNDVARDIIVMKPQPWMRLNGSINRRVLDRWLGSILTECLARTGCTVRDLCIRFPHLIPVDIMFLLEILSDLKCIHLVQMQTQEFDLFAEYEDIKESLVTELYHPERTFVKAHADAMLRITNFIGSKKYNKEFI